MPWIWAVKVKVVQLCPTLQSHELYSPWNSPGQNTGVGNLSLLQRIFPTQGSSPGLLHYKRILYHLSHMGSPRILEWVAYPFSSGSSWPRNWARVFCIAGGFFPIWAMREAQKYRMHVKWKLLSCVWLFATAWTIQSMEFSARILEWVAFPFSRRSFQPGGWTQVSHFAGRFFTS